METDCAWVRGSLTVGDMHWQENEPAKEGLPSITITIVTMLNW